MNQQAIDDDALIRKLKDIIVANLETEDFGAKELAHEIGISSFNLNRKLHSICRKTINQFIREIRLQIAMGLLQKTPGTVSEVGFKVGFSSPAYFSTCFSEYYGYPPGEIKRKVIYGPIENGTEVPSDLKNTPKEPQPERMILPKLKSLTIRTIAATSISMVFILIGFFFIYKKSGNSIGTSNNHPKSQSMSIAVLPFINDSKDQDNTYFINGVLEAILDNLSRIKELEVRPRTSVEQYRNNGTKTISQIARELGVGYIIEGSGQKIGNQVSLYIQLIEVSSDKHLISNRYNMRLEDIFNIQSEVANEIASEINEIVVMGKKLQNGKASTTSSEALNLFMQANEVHNIAESEKKWELDIKAEHLYKRAIQLDSAYADSYASLGWIICKRNPDSALFLANRALHFNPEHPEANVLKGLLYSCKGMDKEAEEAFKLSIKYKSDNSSAYCYLGDMYFSQGNCSLAIENHLKASHLENNSMQERNNVKSLCYKLFCLGFYKEGEKYCARLLDLNNDSSYYYWSLTSAELDLGNYKSAIKSAHKMYSCDSNEVNNIYLLMYTYLYLRDFKEADRLLQRYLVNMKRLGRKIEPDYLLGFVYLKNGHKKEADFHFDGTIKAMRKLIELNQPSVSCIGYLSLAKIYSARNEKAEALQYLQKATGFMGSTVLRVKDFNNCTMLDNIRDEPEFAAYLKEAEMRYRTEHDKVAKVLKKEGILISLL